MMDHDLSVDPSFINTISHSLNSLCVVIDKRVSLRYLYELNTGIIIESIGDIEILTI